MINTEWVICPICRNKTRSKIRQDTVLKNYPLFCPKCKNETLIDIEDMKVNIVKE
ncbi:MAG: cysteine-rich KTR domain-containing protein [Lachnospiraceae bacterium]|nr:cysteine-rich KTR domain-containing protein [Lachnospiraceae bacterium]